MSDFFGTIVKIMTAIVVVAIIAALLSKKSSTATVIQTGGNFFNWLVKTVTSPINGA